MSHYQTKDFSFELPKSLVARYPLPERAASRLLCVNKEAHTIQDASFKDLLDFLASKDLLIFNNTKVIPARLEGVKASGGKIEALIERILSPHRALAHVRASKSPKPGSVLYFADDIAVMVVGRQDNLFELEFPTSKTVLEWLELYGEIPLPPYMDRPAENSDKARYQTVYAEHEGAVAAPTAGLHFDEKILKALADKKIEMQYVTLHVGAGTFQPVKAERLEDHLMHSEWMDLSPAVCEAIKACKQRGGRVVAIGTTVVRVLETAAKTGTLKAYQGETNIFIYPGFQFKVIDALLTNFHLPQSTLLMLVCALGSFELMMQAYHHAVEQHYRFFSYGDAMFIF